MSAYKPAESPIRYLTIDEMMLKIARMRAARLAAEGASATPSAEPLSEVISLTPVSEVAKQQPVLEFPEYMGHCETWCAAEQTSSTRKLTRAATGPLEWTALAVPRATELALRTNRLPSNPIEPGWEPYALAAATGVFAALLLILSVFQTSSERRTKSMMASVGPTLVAGSEPWNEISTDDFLSEPAISQQAPRHVRPKIPPEQLEANVRQMLVSNGFPDIGVSASRRGDIYLAGSVFSLGEAQDIVKVAKLAANGGTVFFLHPEVREPQGGTFFGAMAEHAPDVWGARIRTVVIGSPAYKAGIVVGDVIREFGHAAVGGAADLEKAVANHKPGERVTVRFWRGGSNRYRIARLTGLHQFVLR